MTLSAASQHRLIAIRYRVAAREAKANRKPRRLKIRHLRQFEVEAIYRDRFGKMLPDTNEGREALQVVAECISMASGDDRKAIAGYVRARAPWARSEIEALADAALLAARWLTADEMAWRVGLSVADRSRLKIRTIGAVGMTVRQRKAAQKLKRKEREAARRKAAGAKPRAEYERNSLSRTRPWEMEGLSRPQWYRNRKRDETGPCPILSSNITEHALVSRQDELLATRAPPSAAVRALRFSSKTKLGPLSGRKGHSGSAYTHGELGAQAVPQ